MLVALLDCVVEVLDMRHIGLMGLGDDGMLFTPAGRELFRVPLWLGMPIQRAQHAITRWL